MFKVDAAFDSYRLNIEGLERAEIVLVVLMVKSLGFELDVDSEYSWSV